MNISGSNIIIKKIDSEVRDVWCLVKKQKLAAVK